MNEDSELIRFDWAIKKILRQKANFDVLEGPSEDLRYDDIIEILQGAREKLRLASMSKADQNAYEIWQSPSVDSVLHRFSRSKN